MDDAASITTLIVDDEMDMRMLVRVVIDLANNGLSVVGEAADGQEALDRLVELDPPPDPTVIVLDNRMPRLSGLEVAEKVLERNPNQLVILFSAHLNDDVATKAAEIGITRCVSKQDVHDLPTIIQEIVAAQPD